MSCCSLSPGVLKGAPGEDLLVFISLFRGAYVGMKRKAFMSLRIVCPLVTLRGFEGKTCLFLYVCRLSSGAL